MIEELPVSLPISPLAEVEEALWYFENENANINITPRFSRTGAQTIECNASLIKK